MRFKIESTVPICLLLFQLVFTETSIGFVRRNSVCTFHLLLVESSGHKETVSGLSIDFSVYQQDFVLRSRRLCNLVAAAMATKDVAERDEVLEKIDTKGLLARLHTDGKPKAFAGTERYERTKQLTKDCAKHRRKIGVRRKIHKAKGVSSTAKHEGDAFLHLFYILLDIRDFRCSIDYDHTVKYLLPRGTKEMYKNVDKTEKEPMDERRFAEFLLERLQDKDWERVV